ncbi:ammonium transporter [Desulfobacca acetoxidans]|uniref:Ammonium transporter n=1 Tax=Desulfobacca acetoxidans (strain ATCC 700848 / DSM 11109 / ASRB2) TaxID=880072 RepID=F2NGJ8_DESAR|nr:ammonium transporter [Desulfobacca acetoxidans]AEB07905.1 ammonium transporter [Desulfobacca acetoxidans DSM 11109]
MNSGDTAFVLFSAALVLFMTPGLALFYGGMARSKNVLNTLMQNFIMIALVGVQWALVGYSLAFGPDAGGGIIGNLSYIGLQGVGAEPFKTYSETIPHQAFMIFQAMFAIITPALIIGSWVERFKFSTFLVFSLLWATLVYDPVAHWVWGDNGWLKGLGALDFAGGTVVHINAGIAALAAALIIGKRKGYGVEAFIPHNLPMTVLGAGILWFGWFGFNAGSALAANGLAAIAFVNTNFATCAAALGWMVTEWIIRGKPTMLGVASGAVAGLVAITPAAGFVGPMSSIIIGALAGMFCYLAVLVKPKLGYDDALDVVGVHMVGGLWGALATGLFASKAVNEAGADGLFFGNPGQFGIQLLAVVVTLVYSFVISFILFKVLDATMGLRVEADEEVAGLDISEHQESGYSL